VPRDIPVLEKGELMFLPEEGLQTHSRAAVRAPWLLALLLAVAAVGVAAPAEAAIGVSLEADQASPVTVGTRVTWVARPSNAGADVLWFRFRVRPADGVFHVVRDYGPLAGLAWTSLEEGTYEIEASVRDRFTQETATAVSVITLTTRVDAGQTSVTPTSHPLVFLYSTAACVDGRARVQFQSSGGFPQLTPYKSCTPGRSLNFYLAGLAPNKVYSASLIVDRNREAVEGTTLSIQTGAVPFPMPRVTVLHGPPVQGPQRVLLEAPLNLPSTAFDLNGNVLWYGPPDLAYVTRPGPDGTFFGLLESGIDPAHDAVRRFDLVGMTVQETNVARVNEQLAAFGKRQISGFHHEARELSDGRIAVLADVEQILTDVQGPGSVDVIGDMIVVLDADLKVVWTWDTFDHLDPSRRAVLGESCPASPGCPPYYRASFATDWTHGNAVSETAEGNLLYSSRHQDWLVKIDYRLGQGQGDVIWRLGKDGDFAYDSNDPYPWFSHQHDAGYASGSSTTITLFDNGNTRFSSIPGQTSRGQALEVDEEHRTVRAAFSVNLGVVSGALGSAQRLEDGTYHFDAGLVHDPEGILSSKGISLQIDPSTNGVVSSISWLTPVYRSFRLADLYGSSEAPVSPPAQAVGFR
jgi:arylsulfate sulfotransferase